MMELLRDKIGSRIEQYTFPPPVFATMQGRFVELDLEAGYLSAQYPVIKSCLNPYGAMQGGMIAAAVDNTLGPLSVLIAPLNVTRQLEMIYSRPIPLEMGYIVVDARLLERQRRRLLFRATVQSPEGLRLARAKAVHWIIDEMEV
jgi:acyl-coenzyme A thioesterase PaaI-like protein